MAVMPLFRPPSHKGGLFLPAKLKLLLSMVIFGTIGLLVRFIALSSQETALFRAVIAFLLLLVFRLFFQKEKQQLPQKKLLLLLIFSGAALGLNWVFLFEAYRYTSLSLATLSYYFAPVLVMLFSPFLFHEKTSPLQWACLLCSVFGLVLILISPDTWSGQSHSTGIFFGLTAAVFYAAVVLMNKAMKQLQALDRTFFQFFASLFVLLPYVVATGGFQIQTLPTSGLLALLVLGLLHTGVAYLLYFSSLSAVTGQEAALFSYVDPAIAIFLSIFLLHEPTSLFQLAGGCCILGATLVHELFSAKRQQSPS